MSFIGRTYCTIILNVVLLFPVIHFAQTGREGNFISGKGTAFQDDGAEPHISIIKLSELSFGAFYPGQYGGTIEINADGMRSTSGSVVPLYSGLNPGAAVFEIKCPSNTLIHVLVDPQIELTDGQGNTLICEPMLTEADHFVSPDNAENGFLYQVGARLTLPNAPIASSGNFSGKINIFIILE